MKGDFSRMTFDLKKRYSRVLMQQGRVQLDADWNEQVVIFLTHLHALATDLIGPHGGPRDNCGFRVLGGSQVADLSEEVRQRLEREGLLPLEKEFLIGPGRYYVNGVLSESEGFVHYCGQPHLSPDPLEEGKYLVYLDVWERHITHNEDDEIREVALGGPDTATRAKVIWQVKTGTFDKDVCPEGPDWDKLVNGWQPRNRGLLKAGVTENTKPASDDPCVIRPESKYRGVENQLYRVEIHNGGVAGKASFKWSRDNGTVVFPVLDLDDDTGTNTTTVTVEHLGRDKRFGVSDGDWIEVVEERDILQGSAGPLLKVIEIRPDRRRITLQGTSGKGDAADLLLRRWDQTEPSPDSDLADLWNNGALRIRENEALDLEDGIQVVFQKAQSGPAHEYRTGDYWLIPARTLTGKVEWPHDDEGLRAVPPHGVEHHYAPLALITVSPVGLANPERDCRRKLNQLWELV